MRLPPKEDRLAFGLYLLAALVIILIGLNGCGKKPPEAPVIVSGPSGTAYELPIEQVKDSKLPTDPGKDVEDVVAVITVPPSDTPTVVRVYDKPKKVIKRAKELVTGTKGSPDVAVIADNPGVTVVSEKRTGLWPYLTVLAALGAGIFAARTWLKRFSWITKLLGKLKGLLG